MNQPRAIAVLNTIQALAADLSLSAGLMTCTGLGVEVPLVGTGRVVTKTSFTAGTASVKDSDMGGVAIVAGGAYRLAVVVPGRKDFPGGGKEANQITSIREYTIFTDADAAALTGAQLAAAFVARINADPLKSVTASLVSTDHVRCTLNDVNYGDFYFESPAGAVESVVTPYVAPAGTEDIVNKAVPGAAASGGEYTTWVINVTTQEKHQAVSGGMVGFRNDFVIYADENATNFAAFETELDAILDGSHTPTSDYI